MERFSTLLLMLSGVAIGGYALMPAPPEDTTSFVLSAHVSTVPETAQPDSQAVHPNLGADVRPDVRAQDTVRTFSPTSPAFRQRARLERANAAVLAAGSKSGTWTTVVTTAAQTGAVALKSSKPNDWQTRYELARDLQRELKRVGCYGGEITGVWTRASKAAMGEFMDRVNATLPVDQPDYVLLALVQSHGAIACGAECPSGQVSAEGGRCVPRAVVAQASKKSQRLQERRLAEARLAAERQRDRLASSTNGLNSGHAWKALPPAVASAEPEKLPWLENRNQPVAPATTSRPSEPLPGRMAIGGPVAAPVASSSVAAPSSDWQRLPVETTDGADRSPKAQGTSSTVAALAPDDNADADGSASQVTTDQPAVQPSGKAYRAPGHWKTSRSRYRDEDWRGRPYYGSSGRSRRGDPRPGTMRYNLARVLGGIY